MKLRFLASFIVIMTALPLTVQAEYLPSYVGDTVEYRAKYEDTFVYLARDYGLGYVEMRAANPGVDPWVPGAGTGLVLPTRHILPDAPRDGIVINLPEMRLYAYVNGDNAPYTFPLGIGREGLETPTGATKVARKVVGPTWTPTPRMREEDPTLDPFYPPGPENPMGSHAMYLGWPQYAIHGTNRPFGIGRRISSGCIRLYPEDITRLYEMVPVGTKVTVVDQPIKLGWIGNELFMEAHPSVDQTIEMEETGYVSEHELSDADMQRIIEAAGSYEDSLRWPVIRKVVRERRGYPIAIANRSRYGEASVELPEGESSASEDVKTVTVEKVEEPVAEAPQTQASYVELEKIYTDEDPAGPEVIRIYGPDPYRTLNP